MKLFQFFVMYWNQAVEIQKPVSCFYLTLVTVSATNLLIVLDWSSRAWPNYNNNLKMLLFSIHGWYDHLMVHAMYKFFIKLLKYFPYNQHIGCFKGQVRKWSFLHNYKCGNAYRIFQVLLVAKPLVIVPQFNPAVIVQLRHLCMHKCNH